MPAQESFDAKSKAALLAALESLQRCTADDPTGALDLIKHLKTLEVCLEHSNSVELRPLCALAGSMSDHLIQAEPKWRGEILGWVRPLLDFLASELQVEVEAEPKTPRQRTLNVLNTSGVRTRLALVDGQRLGEILVRMSYLKAADVQRALDFQRERSCQLGEALIELDLMTKDELDTALRVQRQRRNRNTDAWAQWKDERGGERPTGS